MGLLASWLAPLALGWLALRLLVTPAERARAGALLCLASAVPLGVGLSSVLFFAASLVFGLQLWLTTALEVAAVIVLALLGRRALPAAPALARTDLAPRWLQACVGLGAIAAATSFVAQAQALPFGDADGIAIWGNRAIFLQRAFGNWPLVFSPDLVHTDYPLLLPMSLLRAFVHRPDAPPLAGVLFGGAFALCTYVALGIGITRQRGGTSGALATLALCATPFFAVQAAGQTGDVPLACYALLAGVWLRLSEGRALMLVGALVGCGAWTKNEGLLIALLFVSVIALGRSRATGLGGGARAVAVMLAGGAPAYLALAVFKLALAPANDLIQNHDLGKLVPMLTSGERWQMVMGAFADLALFFRGAGAVTGCGAVILVAVALILGRQPGARFLGVEAIVVVAAAACVFGVFLLSPYDLRWHLGTALDRVLLQLWPLALWSVFAAVREPCWAAGSAPGSGHRSES